MAEVESWGGARIATVSGRYYAMDRDKRWDRTELAFNAIVKGEAEFSAESAPDAVRAAYERGETDEFIKPTVVGDGWDRVIVEKVPQNDPDRAKQIAGLGTPTSGPWGNGRLVKTAVGTAIITDDGRVAAGAVPEQVLSETLSR